MSQLSLTQFLSDIASAIREKEGSTDPIPATDFSTRIRALNVVQPIHIYGVTWDGSSTTALTRTDDSADFYNPNPAVENGTGTSPFDNLYPWSGMTVSEHDEAGTVVSIPKFWYKVTQNESSLQIQIADAPVEGFSISPAHMDRGDGAGERDVVYIGRYHCSPTTYQSITGETPANKITRAVARESIHNLGDAVWQSDFAMFWTIRMLYLVEFADFNSQEKIGYGCGDGSVRAPYPVGDTDAMEYHTGTDAENRETYGHTQYRNIEGLWDNVGDWIDGCYYNASGLNVILDPNSFDDATGGTLVGRPSNGWGSAISVPDIEGFDWAMYSSGTAGSVDTYLSDTWLYKANTPCVYCGGSFLGTKNAGMFHIGSGTVAGAGMSEVTGCRLMVLP